MSHNLAKRTVLWYQKKLDLVLLGTISFLPFLTALPRLLGYLKGDPMLYVGEMVTSYKKGLLPGFSTIDPNSGFTTQALGYRAVLDWMGGSVPWWNPYSGVGLPLIAEYQPAAFFPLTFLLILPNGMVWQHLALQLLSGWGTYVLLRQIGLTPLSSFTGGILFAFNGTLGWLSHASALPVPFLPWILYGIERAFVKAASNLKGGWRLFSLAMTMNILAGFPETAYINGLLALAWALLRWVQVGPGFRKPFAQKIIGGGLVSLAISAPQIWAFLHFIPHAFLAGHTGLFGQAKLPDKAFIQSIIAPFIHGPIFAYGHIANIANVWMGIGGYITVLISLMAFYGFLTNRSPLTWLLFVWILLCLAKTFAIPGITFLWNIIPGIKETVFLRYSPPTWELAAIILTAYSIQTMESPKTASVVVPKWFILIAAFLLGTLLIAYLAHEWPRFIQSPGLKKWAIGSALWSIIAIGIFTSSLFVAKKVERYCLLLVFILILEGVGMFVIPTLSNPRSGNIDTAAVKFLKENLGLHRFYTLGPIQPNYGAYWNISSINHNYLPVNEKWVSWIQKNLDPGADPISFTGHYHPDPNKPSEEEALRTYLHNYEWIGVKYVVAPAGHNPFVERISITPTAPSGNEPLHLKTGESLNGIIPGTFVSKTKPIDGVGLLIGNFNNTSTGSLNITLCVENHCVEGSNDLSSSRDNKIFHIPLNEPLEIKRDVPISYTIKHEEGTTPVVLWAYPALEGKDQHLNGPEGSISSKGLQWHLYMVPEKAIPKEVYGDELLTIYELLETKPYFEIVSGDCSINPLSRTKAIVTCKDGGGLMIRKELFFEGWEATINGKKTPLHEYRELFQTIDLPSGESIVEFTYAPPYIEIAWLLMIGGFMLWCRPEVLSLREVILRKYRKDV